MKPRLLTWPFACGWVQTILNHRRVQTSVTPSQHSNVSNLLDYSNQHLSIRIDGIPLKSHPNPSCGSAHGIAGGPCLQTIAGL